MPSLSSNHLENYILDNTPKFNATERLLHIEIALTINPMVTTIQINSTVNRFFNCSKAIDNELAIDPLISDYLLGVYRIIPLVPDSSNSRMAGFAFLRKSLVKFPSRIIPGKQ